MRMSPRSLCVTRRSAGLLIPLGLAVVILCALLLAGCQAGTTTTTLAATTTQRGRC